MVQTFIVEDPTKIDENYPHFPQVHYFVYAGGMVADDVVAE